MTVYYTDIRVLLDPEQSDALTGGGRLQDVSVILTDRHDRQARPVPCPRTRRATPTAQDDP